MLHLPDNRFDLYQPWCELGAVSEGLELGSREIEQMLSYTQDLNEVVRSTFKRPELHLATFKSPAKELTLELDTNVHGGVSRLDPVYKGTITTFETTEPIKVTFKVLPHYRFIAGFYLNHDSAEYCHIGLCVDLNKESCLLCLRDLSADIVTPFTDLELQWDSYSNDASWFFEKYLRRIVDFIDWESLRLS